MASKRIQGITIELEGNTTKLQDALKGVDKQLKTTQDSLRDVNRLLKLDPGNTELLAQKQKLLGEAIEATEERLKTLRLASDQAAAAMANGDEKAARNYDALQREIIETEQNMKSLKDEMTGLNDSLQQETAETEQEVESLKEEMKDFGKVAEETLTAAGKKVKEFGKKVTEVGEFLTKHVTAPILAVGTASVAAFNDVDEGLDIIVKKTGATGDALEDLEKRAMSLATTIPTDFRTAGEAIGEVNTRFGLTGDALEKLAGQFIKFAELNDTDVSSSIDLVQAAMAAFGVSGEKAGATLNGLNKAAQDTGVDINKLAADLTSNAAALRSMGFGINSSTGFLANLNKRGLDTSTVLTAMNKALQNSAKNGKSASAAMKDLVGRIKSAKTETQAIRAATELFGSKAAPALAKAIRDESLSFEKLENQIQDYGHSVDQTFENTLDPIDDFKMALNELKIVGMELVTAAAPMIKSLAQMLQELFSSLRGWWEGLSPLAQETIVKAAAIAAAIGPVLVVGGKVISALGSVIGLLPKLINLAGKLSPLFNGIIGVVKTGLTWLTGIITAHPVVAAVTAVIAGLTLLYNKCEWFRNGVDRIIGGVVDFVKNAVEKIKNFFSFEWKLPKIPLPHFSIQGRFSIVPPKVPHISVDWYKKAMEDGMILNSPTIFGAANGRLLGGGEAGSEAVVGVDSLRSMIREAVARAGGSASPAAMTVVLELREQELARTVFRLNREEMQRVGVQLST